MQALKQYLVSLSSDLIALKSITIVIKPHSHTP